MNKTGQVLNNNNGLTKEFLRTSGLVKSTPKNRNKDGKSRLCHFSNESNVRKGLDTFRDVLRVSKSLNNSRNSGMNILIVNLLGKLSKNLRTFLSQLRLDIVHAVSENWNTLQEAVFQRELRNFLDDFVDLLESTNLTLPLGRRLKVLEQGGKNDRNLGIFRIKTKKSISSSLSRSFDGIFLIGQKIKGMLKTGRI